MTDIKTDTSCISVERDSEGVWIYIEDNVYRERSDITLKPQKVRELIAALEKELSDA